MLTRRIFLDLLATAALALVAVTGVMTLVLAMVEGGRRGLDPATVLTLIPYMIPAMLPYTLPTCLLYACTVVYGGMSGANEITAVKAAGVPPLKLTWPAFLLGAAVAALGLAVTDRVIPACNQALAQVILDDLRNAALTYLKNNNNSMGSPSAKFMLHAQQVRGNELVNPSVTLLKDDQVTTQLTLRAEHGFLDAKPGPKPGEPPQLTLRLVKGVAVTPAANGGEGLRADFQEFPFQAAMPDIVRAVGDLKIENLTYAGCLAMSADYRAKADAIGHQAGFASALQLLGGDAAAAVARNPEEDRRHRAATFERFQRKSIEAAGEVHLRMAQSVAGLAFALLGVPLAILMQRRDAMQTFFVCFVPIIVLFYPSMILAFNAFKELRGLENYHSAAWIIWAPAAALGLAALVALRKLARS